METSNSAVCIYCLQEKPVGSFDREHVLPRALLPEGFGQSLTLIRMVCRDCNHYLGAKLVSYLSHDSFEAVLRLKYGVRGPGKASDLKYDRIEFRLAGPAPWGGVRMHLRDEQGRLMRDVLPQVGFRREGETCWTYVLVSELREPKHPVPAPLARERSIQVVATPEVTADEIDEILELLATHGVTFHPEGESPVYPYRLGDQEDLDLTCDFDVILQRGVAYIAFNYLAYVACSEFARRPDFNAVREFIRYGTKPDYQIVDVTDTPVLFGDTPTLRQTNGHLVTVGWSDDVGALSSSVSLFNHLTYRITLCRRFPGIWRPVRSGHHFDIDNKQVCRMGYL
ncbi:MAG: hypothetical protein HY320_12805 [Armatimonadetes bacterium]|nr:hypothetical protein [Armatimonadota bacterium]